MLPLAADKCVHGGIVKSLRERVAGLDLVTVDEAGLAKATDPDVLEWAAAQGRVLVTQDWNTMIGYARDRVRDGKPMPGLLVRGKGATIRQAVEDLEVIVCCGDPKDFKDQVKFLPLLPRHERRSQARSASDGFTRRWRSGLVRHFLAGVI
jgi:hypothetical protein